MSDYFQTTPFALAILYTVLTLAVGFQISRILYYRHNIYSFQLGFLSLCFIWGIIRACFWWLFPVVSNPWGVIAMTLLWVPVNLQFATFSLLVLFYAHLVHRATWEKSTKKIFAITYIAINVVFIIVQSVWLGMYGYYFKIGTSDDHIWLVTAQSSLAGVVFLILVFILAGYGWLLHSALKATSSFVQPVPTTIFPITFIIFMLFLSRCIFDFVNAAGYWGIPVTSTSQHDNLVAFFLYFFWEILPAVMILGLFWKIPTTHIGGLPRRGKSNVYQFPFPPLIVPGGPYPKDHEATGVASRLFNDPQRYDSDDETTSFLRKGSPIVYTAQPAPITPHSFGKNTPYSTTPTPTIQE